MAQVFCEACQGMHSKRACASVEPRKSYDISNEDSTYRVAIFSRAAVEAAIGCDVADEDPERLIAELTGWSESYGGPGRAFSSAPSLRIFKRNLVVRQFCALDI